MKIKYRFNPEWIVVGLLMVATIIHLPHQTEARANDHNTFSPMTLKTAETQQRIYLARQFKERIHANEHEIKMLITEKEWLDNRIRRLEDLEKAVPWELHHSLKLKSQKIEANLNENERLKNLLGQPKYQFIDESGLDERANDLFAPSNAENGIYNDLSKDAYSNSIHYDTSGDAQISKKLKKEITDRIKQTDLGEWFQFTPDTATCAIENTLPILFASGSAAIPKEYKNFLKRLADLVKPFDVRISINGYADPDAIRTKKYPSNFELGATRAANIVHELVKYGVKPSVFQIGTTGKYRRDAKGMSDKKQLERRTDLKVIFISKEQMG